MNESGVGKFHQFGPKIGCHDKVAWAIAKPMLVYQSWKFGEGQSSTFWNYYSQKSTIIIFNREEYIAEYIAGL